MQSVESAKLVTINTVCATIATNIDDATCGLRQDLARHYYQESIAKELPQWTVDELVGAINCLWDAIAQRPVQQINIHVYQPVQNAHGWSSDHTYIDINCDDSPFLINSISNAITQLGHTIHMTTHPVMSILRDPEGLATKITAFTGQPNEPHLEAVMRFGIDHLDDTEAIEKIKATITSVVQDVQLAVADFLPMRAKMQQLIHDFQQQTLPVNDAVKAENLAFLQWAVDDHFTYVGYRYVSINNTDQHTQIVPTQQSGLGVFRDSNCPKELLVTKTLEADKVKLVLTPSMLVITKSRYRSTVHRAVHYDYLGIKHIDNQGQVIGEYRFYGLYASAAYTARIKNIPVLRRKANDILTAIQALPGSHKGRSLLHVLNNYPRDEILQAPVQELIPIIQGVLQTQERHNLRLFLRFDIYGRFLTALVYIPRERFHTQLRIKLQNMLSHVFAAHHVEFNVAFSDQPLARVQFIVHGEALKSAQVDQDSLEQDMRDAMLSWHDHLQTELLQTLDAYQGRKAWLQYAHAFPMAYQEHYDPSIAVKDLQRLQQLDDANPIETYLYQPTSHQQLHFKVFGQGQAKALSDLVPILEHMGVSIINAFPYVISPSNNTKAWIIDFVIQLEATSEVDLAVMTLNFQDAFSQAYRGRIASDRFNSLILTAGLTWREAELIRGVCAYLRQTQAHFSKAYMALTLNKHPNIARLLMELFVARFDPSLIPDNRQEQQATISQQLTQAVDAVSNLNEDSLIKLLHAFIRACLRCNYFQTDTQGEAFAYLSFKLDPQHIPNMPLPLPLYEIFVYCSWMEAVHLRGGKVARGGLRWSDRRQDYRTEVLGLAKAQMVKNAVIVPVGAKGGFVCKRLPQNSDRDVLMQEVVRCYSTFIQAMLDITDNIVDSIIVPPNNVVRYDDDDPYLVVAADKGTATFSDIANSISKSNQFWLGDAFASGGANGYDHKKMGITARGAWESVKRLFIETGIDCQQQDFTVLGIGDMGGDVFGNGMLLSPHICLQGAFNHLHIFIDPSPDAKTSFAERQRLFTLPRSSWSDYDTKLISAGGGIFERSAKSIPLSAEIQAMLNTSSTQMTPNELILALLQMPVDLFWNGGIGTYVKASFESHADIDDPANDALRVDGNKLGARVVGEGGNLGFSQQGRIEFAQAGGLINTDAIDNSAGVDSSDHEVNIKILLRQMVASGALPTQKRNQLLASMTDEVAALVLDHNYHQSLVLSIAQHNASQNLHDHKQLIHQLEHLKRLDRQLEGLPNDATIDERMRLNLGLTRPEIAVLLAYSKMHFFDEMMASTMAEDHYLSQELATYFPKILYQDYPQAMAHHPLRKEIISTHITNQIGNRMGATFYSRIQEATAANAFDIARAFVVARHLLGADKLWQALNQATLTLPYNVAMDLHNTIQSTLETMLRTLLLQHPGYDIETMIAHYEQAMLDYLDTLPSYLPSGALASIQAQTNILVEAGLPEAAAVQLSQLDFVHYGLDVALIANQHHKAVADTSSGWFAAYDFASIGWLATAIDHLPTHDSWQRLARNGLQQELDTALKKLTHKVMQAPNVDDWKEQNQASLTRLQSLINELQQQTPLDLAKVTVALAELARL